MKGKKKEDILREYIKKIQTTKRLLTNQLLMNKDIQYEPITSNNFFKLRLLILL